MGLKLDIKKTMSCRSDRVKCVDFHPTEPWILVSLYNGQVHIWNYELQSLVKTFEICDLPTRTGKFIARKNWFIVGSDDMQIRVYNYNTHERITAYEAHTDYIRCLAIHPSQPFVLSSADDMTIKLWDWEKGWKCQMTFEGHSHYVMCCVFNPKDANTFATASLDKTIKVWNLGSSTCNYTLEGHEKGVNWVDYYHGGDKPYLVSGADDKNVKIWDYQNKACVQTLQGHNQNVCVTLFHPSLPILISGSEDGTVKIWNAGTNRLENTLNYGLERVWSICCSKGSNAVGIGFDEGTVCIQLGREDPSVSMDSSSGKIIFAKHNEIQMIHLQPADYASVKDGDLIPTQQGIKELGNSEVYPHLLSHSPNGRFAVVCGDGEFIIYTALSWRNKSFGSGLEFVWSQDSNEYAVRESQSKIKLYRNFRERLALQTPFTGETIFGGILLGVKGQNFLCFYDWNTGTMVRRIDIVAQQVFWSENGELVAICGPDSFYILRYNISVVDTALAEQKISDDGVEEAFQVVSESQENVKNATWVGDCFIYTTAAHRLNYLIGGHVHNVAHFEKGMYLLGYLARDGKIIICDKDLNLYAYSLVLNLLEYQTAILRRDFKSAQSILPSLNPAQRNKVARFLEGLDLKELAIDVSCDREHQFDLCLQLNQLERAFKMVQEEENETTGLGLENKWRQLADVALQAWKVPLALECFKKAKDYQSLFLCYQSTGDYDGMRQLGVTCQKEGDFNLAFLCFWLTQQLDACIELLTLTERIPEATLFSKTYQPSHLQQLVPKWKEILVSGGWKKVSEAIASPAENEDLFEHLGLGVEVEMELEDVYKQFRNGNLNDNWEKWRNLIGKQLVEEKLAAGKKDIAFNEALEKKQKRPPSTTTTSVPEPQQQKLAPISPAKKQSSSNTMPPPPPPQQTMGSMGDELESISDNLSHMSMEVNTTGTGSIRGDLEMMNDDMTSEFSFTSGDNLAAMRATQQAQVPVLNPSNSTNSSSLNTTESIVGSTQSRTTASPAPTVSPATSAPKSATSSIPATTQRKPLGEDFDLDDLEAVLSASNVQPTSGNQTSSLTGDPELDDILNM